MHSANGECRSCAAFAHDIIFLKAIPLSVSDVCEKMFTSLGVMARLFLFHLYFFKILSLDSHNTLQLQFPVITWYVIIKSMKGYRRSMLQFPVITWYVIISQNLQQTLKQLQFPVITWYVIINQCNSSRGYLLQFPVITWYVIIMKYIYIFGKRCSSRLLLGML